jgi:hypothetical protein
VTTATATTEAHTEATVSLKHTIDSVMVRETVVIRERPDTVTVERERTVWRERTRHDTVTVVRTDTVIRTVEVVKAETPPPSHRAARTPAWAWMAVAALVALLAWHIMTTNHKLNSR